VPRSLADVAALLPDTARWVEVRSMLLHGQARIIGPLGTSPPTFVALHRDGDQASVVGRASHAAILDAAGLVGEILAATDDTPWVTCALPDWKVHTATLLVRAADSPLPQFGDSEVRFLTSAEMAGLADGSQPLIPETLRDELRSAHADGTPIAVSFEGEHPASFCYAGSITESLWDVSIDTLEPYRRRGHASKVVRFLVEQYAAQGKQPVWGALVSNRASLALAERLGFVPVDALSVLCAPDVVNRPDR
jgi:GNAT superfamily N-acetyltransferase